MAFVNEAVPPQDIDKYGMREINKKFGVLDTGYAWTIDHDRNIFLRYLCHGDRDDAYRHDFSFYWKGTELELRFMKVGEGEYGGKGSTTWTWISGPIPATLAPHKDEILADIKEALRAFKDFGIYSSIADHTAHFTNF